MFDPADKAMCDRAHGRFLEDRKRGGRVSRRRRRNSGAPNLIVIGGLKCGTTSIHHYLSLHPEIKMSKPKELNYFVESLNFALGRQWYESHFDRRFAVRGETSPHYTNLPFFSGVAERIHRDLPDVKLIYMVRDPIERAKSNWRHCIDGGYETRSMEEALLRDDQAYVTRSKYWMQLKPFTERFAREQIKVVSQEDLRDRRIETMRGVFAFLGVDPDFDSIQFERLWQTSRAQRSDGFTRLNRLATTRWFRRIERQVDRTPEGVRWGFEKALMKPGEEAAETIFPPEVDDYLRAAFADDVAALERYAGRRFDGWRDYEPSAPTLPA